jgi:HD superfamily phosphodiesterase
LKRTLDSYVQKDHRILKVYQEARRRYNQGERAHHNFEHVLRDLYRALLIAESEEPVNYSILIPSVLLHDIGFFDPEFKTRGHDVAGAAICRGILSGLGFEKTTIEAVAHCILAHKGRAAIPSTLEAKILYDADVLEKAGLFALLLGGRLIWEFQETLTDYLDRETKDREGELSRGFFTTQGRILDGGRLARTGALLAELRTEVQGERKDFQIREEDLWRGPPPAEETVS